MDPFGDLLCRWTLAYCKIIKDIKVQSTLGFATMGLAANLGIATATPSRDGPPSFHNNDLGYNLCNDH